MKILWGKAAGVCSNPHCKADLISLLSGGAYNVGEMAHIIARSESGPRGVAGGGTDIYDNLILLCPTCHTSIDKAPEGAFPVEMLKQWKAEHETIVRSGIFGAKFERIEDLKRYVARLLMKNHAIWEEYGPESKVAKEDPGSNAYIVWELRKMDTIIPNNSRILKAIEHNQELLSMVEYKAYVAFRVHAESFEQHQYNRLDSYKLFPPSFNEAFGL